MVSFQCHACGDVVKKPKLDTHNGRCHSGFDCIDCHTTFNSPAEYKRHTSCISEAEKYQKGLYKGPKTGQDTPAPRNNYTNIPASTAYSPAVGNYQNQSQGFGSGGGRGGYGGNRGGSGWGRPQFQRNNATGANDTPLGTPTRTSEATVCSEKKKRKSVKVADGAEDETKGKEEKKLAVEVKETDERDHKSKKRKRDEVQDSVKEVDSPVKEKKKKSKKDADSMEVDVVQETGVNAQVKDKKDKKEKKSHKKDKRTKSTDPGKAGMDAGVEKPKREDKYKREKMKREKKRQAKEAGVAV